MNTTTETVNVGCRFYDLTVPATLVLTSEERNTITKQAMFFGIHRVTIESNNDLNPCGNPVDLGHIYRCNNRLEAWTIVGRRNFM